jgi:hypothetical protein
MGSAAGDHGRGGGGGGGGEVAVHSVSARRLALTTAVQPARLGSVSEPPPPRWAKWVKWVKWVLSIPVARPACKSGVA